MNFVFPQKLSPPSPGREDVSQQSKTLTRRRKRPPHCVVLPQMTEAMDHLGSFRYAWRPSISRFDDALLDLNQPVSTSAPTAKQRPATASSQMRSAPVASWRTSTPVRRPSTAQARGRYAGKTLEELNDLLAEMDSGTIHYSKPKTRPRTALSRPPSRSIREAPKEEPHRKPLQLSDRRCGNSAMRRGRSVTAVVGSVDPHGGGIDKRSIRSTLSSTMKTIASKRKFALRQDIIYAAVQRFTGAIKAKNGRGNFNIFNSVLQDIGLTDSYLNDRIFRCLDTQGVGSVGVSEFTMGLTAMWDGKLADKIAMYFKLIDADGNGQLDHSELVSVLKQWSGLEDSGKEAFKLASEIFIELGLHPAQGSIGYDQFCVGVLKKPSLCKLFERIFN